MLAGQNDNGRLCQTPTELAIVQAEGSPMGPLMRAINRIADAIASEFPDVAVGTLAYGGTITPPRTAARENVVIQLAPIGAHYGRPFTDPSNKPLADLLTAWGAKCKRRCCLPISTACACRLANQHASLRLAAVRLELPRRVRRLSVALPQLLHGIAGHRTPRGAWGHGYLQ